MCVCVHGQIDASPTRGNGPVLEKTKLAFLKYPVEHQKPAYLSFKNGNREGFLCPLGTLRESTQRLSSLK